MDPNSSPSPIDRAAESFRYYADTIYPGRSPLYVSLAKRVAEDPELLEAAAPAWEKNALPNVLFAAVQFILVNGERHQLSPFYPLLKNAPQQYHLFLPYFANFFLEPKNEISAGIHP